MRNYTLGYKVARVRKTVRMLKAQRTLTISAAAEELGVSAAWLRFGERLGSLPLAQRSPNGYRVYTPADIDRLRRLGVGERKRRLAGCDE